MTAGLRTHINYVIRCPYYLLVMLYYNNCVANLLQLAQNHDKSCGIATVQPDAGFIQYIQRSHKAAAQ